MSIQTVTCTVADTEYEVELPPGTKQFTVFTNAATGDIRWSPQQGQVAAGTAYVGIPNGEDYWEDGLDLTGQKFYVASGTAGLVVVISIGS